MYGERDKSHQFHGGEVTCLKCSMVKYRREKALLSWHILRKSVMIVFISHLDGEEMRVVVSSSRLEPGTLRMRNCRLHLGSARSSTPSKCYRHTHLKPNLSHIQGSSKKGSAVWEKWRA